jgi:phosphoglycerate dehydrogenase-like enzyme
MRVAITFELDPDQWERLRRDFPEVEFVEALGEAGINEAIPSADVVFGGSLTGEQLSAAVRLRWVQAFSAGINRFPLDDLRTRAVTLTTASGAHSIQIAENILGMMLAFAIRLPDFFQAQQARHWERGEIASTKFELDGATLLVAGLGGLGIGLSKKSSCLGMRVIGVRNRPLAPPEGVDEVVTRDRLLDALGRADHVALCLPLTQETTDFLGEQELRAMKPSAYVYNAGRGKSINREALLRALREGWIAGAGLDVTDPEPLPPEDPLWSFPNVILTQHTSGASRCQDRRVTDIFAKNLRRFLNGAPLTNVVDFDRGY